MVVTDVSKFFTRVEAAAKRQGYRGIRGLIKYYDPSIFNTPWDNYLEVPFLKQDRLSYQKDFRFFYTGTVGCIHLVLDIGDISDFTFCCPTAEINDSLNLEHS